MQALWIVLFIGTGIGISVLVAFFNRRWDAFIRAREDYDEDVDGKMTKKEKAEFQARKEAEAKLTRMPFTDVVKERPRRFVACLFLGTLASASLVIRYGVNTATWTLLVFLLILILIAMIDLDTMEIPFSLNLTILALGGLSILTFQATEPFSQITIVNRIVGMLLISVPMILINLFISGAFGGGDVKLMFAAGFLLGWKIILTGFFLGAIVGGAVGVTVMVRKKKGGKEHIPFGPSLCIGLYLAIMFGTQMVDWYTEILKRSMGH